MTDPILLLIYNFLTQEGHFDTLQKVIHSAFEFLMTLIVNMANVFIAPIINLIVLIFPFDYTIVAPKLNELFNYIEPYCNYILDLCIVPKSIIAIVIGSIIFRITIQNNSFVVKILIHWYDKLKP